MIEKKIKSYRDFELNYYKERHIKYYLTLPGKPEGLILYISGFGDDTSLEYRKKLLNHFTETYNYAAATLDYSAVYARPNQGATLKIPNLVEFFLRSFFNDFSSPIFDLIKKFASLRPDKNQPIYIPTYILPKNDDYQNFGLLPAIDCVFTLKSIYEIYGDKIPKKIILVGSSYGGYIANLITKFIPSSISAIFDNSSWVKVNKAYINGIEYGNPEFSQLIDKNIILIFSTITPWQTSIENLPTYFDQNRKMIREFSKEHLRIMFNSGANKIIYRYIHSYNDKIAPTQDKILYVNEMKNLGFDVDIEVFDETKIDNKFIKSMEHGMGISIKEFFKYMYEKYEGSIKEREKLDFEFEHKIIYPCKDINYQIYFTNNSIYFDTISK